MTWQHNTHIIFLGKKVLGKWSKDLNFPKTYIFMLNIIIKPSSNICM
jgi:hypothetical protein